MARKRPFADLRKRHGGFSIIEVAISVVVLGTALIACSQLLCLATRAGDTDESRAIALSELERKVEMLRQRDFDLLESEERAPLAEASGTDCDIEVTVTQVSQYLKKVTVVIYRQGDSVAEASESAEFYVADCAFPLTRTW